MAGFPQRVPDLAHRAAPLIVAGSVLGACLFTMPPDLTFVHAGQDGGDLITAAFVGGIPHPTGYPTWTMLGWLFTKLPFGSVAWRVTLLSAVATSFAAALLFLIGRRLCAGWPRLAADAGSAAGALLLAFSGVVWGQSVIPEVYTLNLFFVALVLFLLLRWLDGAGQLWPAALAAGIGMGNHVTLCLLAPTAILFLGAGRRRMNRRVFAAAAAALLAGLGVYLFLPIRAAAVPVVSWGGADEWEGFVWLVTGKGYQHFAFALPSDEIVARLLDWGDLTWVQLPVAAWPLVLLGIIVLFRRAPWVAGGSLLHASLTTAYGFGYKVGDAFVHLLPPYFHFTLWAGVGGAALLAFAGRLRLGEQRRTLLVRGLAVGLLLLVARNVMVGWAPVDASRNTEAVDYLRDTIDRVPPDSVILAKSDAHTFSLWYAKFVEGRRPDVTVMNPAMYQFVWYRRILRRHAPDVADFRSEVHLVRTLRETRPVFLAEEPEHGIPADPDGVLWRVRTE